MRITTASISDVGIVRSHNEDYCAEFERNGRTLLVVADGMGGHKGGATASRVAVESIGEVFHDSQSDPSTLLVEALVSANERIFSMSQETDELRGMGTTAVALLLGPGDSAWVGHVGDSRAYRVRDGRIEALTADHSVVAEMERRGLITREEANVHPRRNEILRSVGVEPTVEPEVGAVEVQPGDTFVLCSDGLSGLVNDEEIADVVNSEPPNEAVKILVNLANDLGGTDNVTIQIVSVTADPLSNAPTPPNPVAAISTSDLPESDAKSMNTRRLDYSRIVGATAIAAGLVLLGLVLFFVSRQ
jgi:protein phosphatase